MPVALRTDFESFQLRAMARRTKDAAQARRLLALAAIYEGASRTEAARIGGVTLQIVRDWVVKFNARGPAGLIDRKPPGVKRRLTVEQEAELNQLIAAGPNVATDGVVRWRCVDLQQLILARWDISYHERTIGKILRRLGYRHISARPRHIGQEPAEIEAFKKTSPAGSARSPRSSRRRRR